MESVLPLLGLKSLTGLEKYNARLRVKLRAKAACKELARCSTVLPSSLDSLDMRSSSERCCASEFRSFQPQTRSLMCVRTTAARSDGARGWLKLVNRGR